MKYPPFIQIFGLLTRTQTFAQHPVIVKFGKMKAEWRPNCDKAADRFALLEALDHIRQRSVGQSVAVIGKEDFLVAQRDVSPPQAVGRYCARSLCQRA